MGPESNGFPGFYLRNVQWRPFQPWEQTQVPFLHCPCSAQRLSHGNWSHRLPVQPALQRHLPFSHTPFRPQSKLQTAAKEREKTNIVSSVELEWMGFRGSSPPPLLLLLLLLSYKVDTNGGDDSVDSISGMSVQPGVTKDIRRLLSLQFPSASEWNVCKFISRLSRIYILHVIYDTWRETGRLLASVPEVEEMSGVAGQ